MVVVVMRIETCCAFAVCVIALIMSWPTPRLCPTITVELSGKTPAEVAEEDENNRVLTLFNVWKNTREARASAAAADTAPVETGVTVTVDEPAADAPEGVAALGEEGLRALVDRLNAGLSGEGELPDSFTDEAGNVVQVDDTLRETLRRMDIRISVNEGTAVAGDDASGVGGIASETVPEEGEENEQLPEGEAAPSSPVRR